MRDSASSPLTNQSNAVQHFNPSSPISPLESPIDANQRFRIPTKTDALSSGFPFHPRLHDLGVTMDEWHLFTSDILNAGKLTPQEDYAAWSTGIAAGTLSTAFVLVFGPVVGYYTGKSVHKKVVVSKVKERLLQDGDMRSVLRRWNERNFAEKGFEAWLELPLLGDEAPIEETTRKPTKKEKAFAKKAKRRFKIIIIPNNDKRAYSWSSIGSPKSSNPGPALTVVPFVEAPTAETRGPVEMETGCPDNIQPLVNHQVETASGGDQKYDFGPVDADVRPNSDTKRLGEAKEENSGLPAEVSNGRTPISNMIPPDERKDSRFADPTEAFEMDSGQTGSTKETTG